MKPVRSAKFRSASSTKERAAVITPLNDRVIGISLEDLRKADRVMALAGGRIEDRRPSRAP